MKQKYYVELNRQEWRLVIEGLNRFRNKLIVARRYKVYPGSASICGKAAHDKGRARRRYGLGKVDD